MLQRIIMLMGGIWLRKPSTEEWRDLDGMFENNKGFPHLLRFLGLYELNRGKEMRDGLSLIPRSLVPCSLDRSVGR